MAENQEDKDNKDKNESQDDQELQEALERMENEASGQGWVPKDKFRGEEKDWVDAETFVKRGREILPILRKNNENLLRELNHTKDSLKQFKQDAEEFKKFQKDSYERKAKELETQLATLKTARAQAITDGDGQRANALDDAIDAVKDEVRESKDAAKAVVKQETQAPASIDPNLQIWLEKNDWFGKDKRLTAQTNAIGEVLRQENPGLSGVAFLDALDQALKEEFPQKFGPKRTPNFQAESGAGRGKESASSGGGGKKSYAQLPADAKEACDRFVKQKLMTREQYLEDYDWQGA